MKQWIVFIFAIGTLLVLLSSTVDQGFGILISGIMLIVIAMILFLSKGAKLMEVYRTMQGTPEQCYDLLIESLLMDLATSTGHNLTEDEIHEGYQYQKQLRGRMGNSGSVTVTLLELKRPNTYSVRFESAQGINTLEYHLEPLDDSQFKLTYAESYHSIKKRKMLNFKLMERFYRKGSQKRINLLLDQIQTILNERSVKA
ncbi:DUF3284 domain-containing protein [Erysipelothrix piscisicarius]|uniref:DUF3284 domain-containing protein n=2 Tax=Erysipelothrix TaxID=1647 RepID=UPI002F93DA80